MSIGRDVYCDTRLMLSKLEERFPDGALGARQPEQKAIQELLDRWTIDGGVFNRAAALIPTDMPLLNDPKFIKDREDLTGRSWAKDEIVQKRPEALADMREMFGLLETTLLADGREWILKTEKPSLADIEGKSSKASNHRSPSFKLTSCCQWVHTPLSEVRPQLFGRFTGSRK